MSKIKKIISTVLIFYVLVPLVIFLVGAEIYFRDFKPMDEGVDRIPHPYIEMGGFYRGGYYKMQLDPIERPDTLGYVESGWLKIPSFQYGTEVKSIAERGKFLFRERVALVEKEKAKDEIRVFILGGSVAFGEGASSLNQRWFIHLEHELREKTGKNIVVISAANHSHVSTQERIIYDLYVSAYQPDVLIILNGFNDANTGVSGTRPGDPYAQGIAYKKSFSPFYSFLNDISKHSKFVRYILHESLSEVWYSTPRTPELNAAQGKSVANVYYENIKALNKRCGNEKIKCFFFLQPYQKLTEHYRNNSPTNETDDMVLINYNEILKRLPEHKFLIDLTHVFDQEPKANPFYDPAHFRDGGHFTMAKEISEILLKKKAF